MSYLVEMRLWLLMLMIILQSPLNAQTCTGAKTFNVFHANLIRTSFSSTGNQFSELHSPAFEINYHGYLSQNTIYAAAPWISGRDTAGELHVAGELFANSTRLNFRPGSIALAEQIDTSEICARMNRSWEVIRPEILEHIADYAEDGKVDREIEGIFEWPGAGNPHFGEVYGVTLHPDNIGWAPFQDLNGNDVYEPEMGEYPHPEQLDSTLIAEQMIWTVFNDAFEPEENQVNLPFGFEIHRLAWAVYCTDTRMLNRTIFTSHKIINRSQATYDSVRFAMWVDHDVQCLLDDLSGSWPEANTFFNYNPDTIVFPEICYPEHMMNQPVQSVTFLNRPLNRFINSVNGGNLGGWPIAIQDPFYDVDLNEFMNGRYVDGTPMSPYNHGYNPNSSHTAVDHLFPDNPSDIDGWAHVNLEPTVGDWRNIGVTDIGSVLPGDVFTLDVAYTFFQDTGVTNLDLINRMYQDIPALQAAYDSRFVGTCTAPDLCDSDCVWPGDANADGVVNDYDFLGVYPHQDRSGTPRTTPPTWMAHAADPWTGSQYNSENLKHADCNGDGKVSIEDVGVTTDNMDLQRPDYQAVEVIHVGDALEVVAESDAFPLPIVIDVYLNSEAIDSLFGLGFELVVEADGFVKDPLSAGFSVDPDNAFRRMTEIDDGWRYVWCRQGGDQIVVNDQRIARLWLDIDEGMTQTDSVCFYFRNIVGIDADGNDLGLGGETGCFAASNTVGQLVLKQGPLQVYPNPTSSQVHIVANIPLQKIQLLTVTGLEVQSQPGGAQEVATIDVSDLPSGLYFVQITTANSQHVSSVVVR